MNMEMTTNQKEIEERLEELTRKISQNQHSQNELYQRAQTYLELKQYNNSIRDLNMLISMDGKQGRYYELRGRVYYEMQRYQDTLLDIEFQLQLEPFNAQIINERVKIQEKLCRYYDAYTQLYEIYHKNKFYTKEQYETLQRIVGKLEVHENNQVLRDQSGKQQQQQQQQLLQVQEYKKQLVEQFGLVNSNQIVISQVVGDVDGQVDGLDEKQNKKSEWEQKLDKFVNHIQFESLSQPPTLQNKQQNVVADAKDSFHNNSMKKSKPVDVSRSVHPDPVKSKKILHSRALFTDWMRSISIYLVVAVHIVVSIQRSLKLDQEEDQKLDSFLRQSLQFIMPLFFYFSGRSAAFSKDSYLMWNWKKVQRLLVPLVFGTLIIVIPTAYVGREYRPQANTSSEIDFGYFYRHYFQDEFSRNGFEWLWFLPVLFGLSWFNYTFFRAYRPCYLREAGGFQKQDFGYYVWHLLQCAAAAIGLGFIDINYTYLIIIGSIPYILYGFIAQFFGWFRDTNRLELIFIPNVAASLILSLCQKEIKVDSVLFEYIQMIVYHNFHFLEGFSNSLVYDEYQIYKQQSHHLRWRPISLLVIILLICIGAPGTNINEGYFWRYPFYNSRITRTIHVGGTWIWIAILLRWSQTFFNQELNKFQYKFFNQSSIVVYISHWIWIEIPNKYLVYDYQLSLFVAFIIITPLCLIGCALTYYLILKLPYLGFFFGIDPQTLLKQKKKLDQKLASPKQENPPKENAKPSQHTETPQQIQINFVDQVKPN